MQVIAVEVGRQDVYQLFYVEMTTLLSSKWKHLGIDANLPPVSGYDFVFQAVFVKHSYMLM